jgi:type I restriction enzyme S subunit
MSAAATAATGAHDQTLPPGWAWVCLGDCCTIIMGQSPPSSEYNDEGKGLPFFQGKAEFTDLFPVPRKWCTSPLKVAEAGDILLSVRAPVGPTNMAPSLCCIGRGLAALRPEGNISNRYVLYALRAFVDKFAELSGGTTFDSISAEDIKGFQIPLAPIEEQRRIVAAIERHLTRLDAVVETLRRDRIKLKNARAALLRDAVEGKLTEGWRASHPVSEDGEALLRHILAERRTRWEAEQLEKMRARGQEPRDDRWKQAYREPAGPDTSTLPPLPPGWCWATVEQVGETISGVTKGRRLEGRATVILPYLRVANVQRGYLDLNVIKTIEVPAEEVEMYSLHENDIVLTEGGDPDKLGRAALWQGEIASCIHQNHIFRIRLYIKDTLPRWVMFYANSKRGQDYFLKAAKQTVNLASINLRQLRLFPISLPPLEEQRQIVAEVERRLTIIQQAEVAIERSLKRAERLRQSILKRAFSGQLVPQDPRDEPASQLLERIQAERARRQREKEGRRPGQRRNGMGAGPGDPSLSGGGPGGVANSQPPEPLDPQQLARPSLWEAESDTGGGEGRSQT